MKTLIPLIIGVAVSAASLENLTWDPSPTDGVTYRIYQHTNSPASAGQYRDVGTNLVTTVSVTGRQYFQVVAVLHGIESLPSNDLEIVFVERPNNLRKKLP